MTTRAVGDRGVPRRAPQLLGQQRDRELGGEQHDAGEYVGGPQHGPASVLQDRAVVEIDSTMSKTV